MGPIGGAYPDNKMVSGNATEDAVIESWDQGRYNEGNMDRNKSGNPCRSFNDFIIFNN